VLYLWLKWFIVLNTVVVIEGILSWRYGLFTQAQADRMLPEDQEVLPFMNHGGMWGDFFIISPLIAWIIPAFSRKWGEGEMVICFIVALLIGAGMFKMWTDGSREAWDPFGQDGRATANGWIHFGYMVFCLTVVLLFYFGTAGTTGVERGIVTLALFVHVVIGVLQPEFYVWGEIARGRWIQLGSITALLGASYIFAFFRH